jgi:hypothetical protein
LTGFVLVSSLFCVLRAEDAEDTTLGVIGLCFMIDCPASSVLCASASGKV